MSYTVLVPPRRFCCLVHILPCLRFRCLARFLPPLRLLRSSSPSHNYSQPTEGVPLKGANTCGFVKLLIHLGALLGMTCVKVFLSMCPTPTLGHEMVEFLPCLQRLVEGALVLCSHNTSSASVAVFVLLCASPYSILLPSRGKLASLAKVLVFSVPRSAGQGLYHIVETYFDIPELPTTGFHSLQWPSGLGSLQFLLSFPLGHWKLDTPAWMSRG